MKPKPKLKLYQNIIEYFTDLTSRGELKPGDRIPTEQELAEQFDVSRITVIRALRELEYMGMLVRVKKRGSFIREDYGHNKEKDTVMSDKNRLPIIAVLLPFGEEFGLDVLQGVEEACVKNGYYVTYHNTKYDLNLERNLLYKLVEDSISGAIVYPCASNKNIEVFSKLLIEKFPFVLIDRTIEGLDAPHIVSDNFQAGYLMTKYLLDLGHCRIDFVCTSLKEALSVMERYRGYCKALIDASISPRSEWLFEDQEHSDVIHDDSPATQLLIAKERLGRILRTSERPKAIIAINDKSAMNLIKAAKDEGLNVPEDISIVGFDNISISGMVDFPLTTIEQKFRMQGKEAAEMVIDLCKQDEPFKEIRKVVLDIELIQRESAARPSLTSATGHPN